MKDYKTIWKQLAASKSITTEDTVAYFILKTMSAKAPYKRDLLRFFITAAFSPKTKCPENPWNKLISAVDTLEFRISRSNKPKLLGEAWVSDILESAEEEEMFLSLLRSLRPYDFDRVYTYVFVRQDISPEYQLVQAAHATMALGKALAPEHDPHNTYFTVVGVKDAVELREVERLLVRNKFRYEKFIEPDMPNGDKLTAIATHPILWRDRMPLMNYPLLTFTSKES